MSRKEKDMEIVKIPIGDINPYENNAKIHTQEQIEQIKKSIENFGMNDPIGVWGKDNIVVEGHGRLEALNELGYTEVECVRLDHMTDDERKAYTLAHNKLTMETGFDIELLNIELEELQETDIDMSDYGFHIEADQFEPIDFEQKGGTLGTGHIMKIDSKVIELTDDEYDDLSQKFEEYLELNGVSFGFVRSLLNG